MPIKAQCECGFSFALKDEFAGKQVKCPKCGETVLAGQPSSPAPRPAAVSPAATARKRPAGSSTIAGNRAATISQTPTKPPTVSKPGLARAGRSSSPSAENGRDWPRTERFNPLLDLLDEYGVKAASSGPTCPNCQTEMAPTAVVCVHCGFNRESGERMELFSDVKDDHETTSRYVESDTDRTLAKAEKEIRDAPTSVINQDFGDGADSIVVALGALLGFGLIIVAGVTTVLVMDRLQNQVNPALISFISSTAIATGCMIYITYMAFRVNAIHGVICLATIQYCVIFAFMQGRSLVPFGLIMQVALIIAGITGFVCFG